MTAVADSFQFLSGVLNILVIDPDDTTRLTFYVPLFSGVSCCSVHYARSNREALTFLRSGKRFHVCITELGMYDVENDDLYIVHHYASHCSVVVVTGNSSAAKGARCIQLGARRVYDKGDQLDVSTFYKEFSRVVLINVINCRYDKRLGDTLTTATKILFDGNPGSVTEWAELMRISDRHLRNLWHTGSGFGAKQMLFLFDCIGNALRYYGCLSFSDMHSAASANRFFKKQYAVYFRAHREILLFILS